MTSLGGLRLEVFRGLAGLDALRDVWQALFERLEQPSYLHPWEWHRSYIESETFDPGSTVFCVAFDGDEAVLILPLIRKVRNILGWPLRFFDLPYAPVMPHADLLIDPRVQHNIDLPAILRALHTELGEPWDAIRLGLTLEDSSASALIAKLRRSSRNALIASHQPGLSSAIEIAPYEDMLAGFSKSFRKSLRKSRDRLDKLDGVAFRAAREPGELASAFPLFLAVEASGWKGRAGSAIKTDPKLEKLFDSLRKNFGPTGCCRINLLMHGEHVMAGHFGVAVGDRFYVFKSGYDESYKLEAPGKMLRERVLRHLSEESGIRYLDMVANQHWHGDWRPVQRRVFMHYLCRPSIPGLLIWASMTLKQRRRATAQREPQTGRQRKFATQDAGVG